jgi:hypothetical protein
MKVLRDCPDCGGKGYLFVELYDWGKSAVRVIKQRRYCMRCACMGKIEVNSEDVEEAATPRLPIRDWPM